MSIDLATQGATGGNIEQAVAPHSALNCTFGVSPGPNFRSPGERATACRLQLDSSKLKACSNPVCKNPIPELPANGTKRWRRTKRRFCSDRCRIDGWVLARAARILFCLEPEEWWAILDTIKEHKAKADRG
jgi:hypothetical protein